MKYSHSNCTRCTEHISLPNVRQYGFNNVHSKISFLFQRELKLMTFREFLWNVLKCRNPFLVKKGLARDTVYSRTFKKANKRGFMARLEKAGFTSIHITRTVHHAVAPGPTPAVYKYRKCKLKLYSMFSKFCHTVHLYLQYFTNRPVLHC